MHRAYTSTIVVVILLVATTSFTVAIDSDSATNSAAHTAKRLANPCFACTHLLRSVTTAASRPGRSRDQIILQTQTICQQENLSAQLRLECTVYNDVGNWLTNAGVLGASPVQLKGIHDNPLPACQSVSLCSGMAINTTTLGIAESQPSTPVADGAAIVRFRLKPKWRDMRRPSAEWIAFVKDFITSAAKLLEISPQLLSVHMGANDKDTELLVSRQPGPPYPRALSVQFRNKLQLGSNAPVPQLLRDCIDQSVRLQAYSSVINPTVDSSKNTTAPTKPNNMTTINATSCGVIYNQVRENCGEAFQCTDKCESTFGMYMNNCLRVTKTPEVFAAITKQYKSFFTMCKKCPVTRGQQVQKQCFPHNETLASPPAVCGVACSELYRPYFNECLSGASQTRTATQFYEACNRCTAARHNSVLKTCGGSNSQQTPLAGGANYSYPALCKKECATEFLPLFDQCYEGHNLPHGSKTFRSLCRVTMDGGIAFRFRLNAPVTSVANKVAFKGELVTALASMLSVPQPRVAITLLTPGAPLSNGTAAKYMYVDGMLRVSAQETDPASRTLVAELARLISHPHSKLYRADALKKANPGFGVRLLVAGSHNYDDLHPLPTSMQVASEELKRQQSVAPGSVAVKLWSRIVKYHQHLANSSVTQLQINFDRASIEWLTARVNNAPEHTVQFLKWNMRLHQELLHHATKPRIEFLQSIVTYMNGTSHNAPAPVRYRDYSNIMVQWVSYSNGSTLKQDLARAQHQYFADLVDKKSVETLHVDNATVILLQHKVLKAKAAVIAADTAVLEYFRHKQAGAGIAVINAAEANVEYLKAVMSDSPSLYIALKKALVTYMNVKRDNGSPGAQLQAKLDVGEANKKWLASLSVKDVAHVTDPQDIVSGGSVVQTVTAKQLYTSAHTKSAQDLWSKTSSLILGDAFHQHAIPEPKPSPAA
jgi:hypothetical protein